MDKMKDIFKKLKKTGFFSIFISSIFSKVIVFLGGILLVRLLPQDEYANYTLIINAFSVLCLFGDFGSSAATLQFMTEERDNQSKAMAFLKYGLKIAISSACLSSLLIVLSSLFYPFKNSIVAKYTAVLFIVPIITSVNGIISNVLRAKGENHKYSLLQFLTTIIHYLVIIPFTLLWGLFGSIISQYFYNFITFLVGIFISKKFINNLFDNTCINNDEKKSFLKLAIGSQVNNSIGNLLYTVDIFVIGLMIANNTDLAVYKVATIIPGALVFLPSCFIIYIFPYFIKNKKNKNWLASNLKLIIKYGSIIYGILTVVIIIFSKYIITILYGSNYIDAVIPFNILMVGFYFMSTVTMPTFNVIYSMRKVKINIFINLISIVLNAILNVILIYKFGIIGAALATALVKIIMAIISWIYVNKLLISSEVKK